MINNELAERMAAIAEQSDFQAKAEQVSSTEELAELFGEYGVTLSAEEINIAMANASAEGELSAEDMDAVSGGAYRSGFDMARWVMSLFIPKFPSTKPTTTRVDW